MLDRLDGVAADAGQTGCSSCRYRSNLIMLSDFRSGFIVMHQSEILSHLTLSFDFSYSLSHAIRVGTVHVLARRLGGNTPDSVAMYTGQLSSRRYSIKLTLL